MTNPLMRPLASLAPPLSVVHHTGRKSGKAYHTPVLALLVRGGIVTPLLYGTDVDWCQNVVAAGRYELSFLGHRIALNDARIVGADIALPKLPLFLRPGWRLLNPPGYLIGDRAEAD